MMSMFDIFSGRVDKDAVWVETVEGFGNAYELMTKVGTKTPGPYFIISKRHTPSVVP
jgi:hypothetical protein